ncbi:nitrogen fixation protein FixH [Hymenobacter oligotrophus]|uniref:Nitrogen fixation protein FixH n=1 Tax=Hymenobacter oligotrophus TaxID=2319843 RepID=A0A3B7R2L6_9BACT|nr:FixH family protein [Hymenobacter oligotrophus]AYA37653.1 nitrogen fixation protein FixH [Hymenobacter oligotrophus]
MTSLTVNKPAPQRSLWPYAIVAAFVLFALFIGYMVKQAMSTQVDLVSKDYYQQELRHQQRMDAVARTNALPGAVDVAFDAATDELTLQLPANLAGQQATGKVQFFRPSDQTLDFAVPLQADATGTQRLSTAKLKPGYWRIRLDFEAAGQAYFVEKNITVAN